MNKETIKIEKRGKKYFLTFNVGVQHFDIMTISHQKENIEWYEKQLRTALDTLIQSAVDNYAEKTKQESCKCNNADLEKALAVAEQIEKDAEIVENMEWLLFNNDKNKKNTIKAIRNQDK